MSELPCCTVCDYTERQNLIDRMESHPSVGVGLTVLYWGIYCNNWHTMIINSIGSMYPSNFTHFDSHIALTGQYPALGFYTTGNFIKIPRTSPPGDMSGYIFCYVAQHTFEEKDINSGLTAKICDNLRAWYGPVIVFATDPINHVRRCRHLHKHP